MTKVTRSKTGHLIEITRDDGSKDIKWDWDKLLEEVQAATAGKVLTVDGHGDVHEVKTKKPAAKKPAAKKAPAKKKKETK